MLHPPKILAPHGFFADHRQVASAQVDLNPHQVDAALFAFNSPLSKGALFADEVGLGKTIEAGLVLCEKMGGAKEANSCHHAVKS